MDMSMDEAFDALQSVTSRIEAEQLLNCDEAKAAFEAEGIVWQWDEETKAVVFSLKSEVLLDEEGNEV